MRQTFVGLDSFCWYLNTIGRRAWIAGDAIALQGSPIEYVRAQLGGFIGVRQMFAHRAFRFSIGGLPIAGRQVLPMQYHWLVRIGRYPHPWFRTKLVRRGGDVTFTGEGIGDLFSRDRTVIDPVAQFTTSDDAIELVADPANALVRIVHRRPIVLEMNLFQGNLGHLTRRYASPELIASFERMATILKTL